MTDKRAVTEGPVGGWPARLEFLQSTDEAAAGLAHWDRAALER